VVPLAAPPWVADRVGAHVAARSFSFSLAIVSRRDARRTEGTMSLYQSVGTAVGTREALELAQRLSAWHDAMVRHRRGTADACEMDCPHEQAVSLWLEALEVYGDRALELAFLRTMCRDG
jgi:hypothetical protein